MKILLRNVIAHLYACGCSEQKIAELGNLYYRRMELRKYREVCPHLETTSIVLVNNSILIDLASSP